MANIDLSSYKELYIKTAHEYLEAMHASMVLIIADLKNESAIETIYRSAHSLKSQSLIMGYRNTASLNEFLELTFRNIKEGKITFTEKVLEEIKTALNKVEQSVQAIETLDKELTLQEQVAN